ncbi:hypothetical protein C0Q70_08061 [Pomacea canaliculata]|uniref:Uncharacterized protein n=1 Tax=Pomacea canaliculata TaxID=400727 RepID=A0A2T7PGQ8_POMCA|nr:hypothetical protein C0Q70_08061 [Pomacea canaliculata]
MHVTLCVVRKPVSGPAPSIGLTSAADVDGVTTAVPLLTWSHRDVNIWQQLRRQLHQQKKTYSSLDDRCIYIVAVAAGIVVLTVMQSL